MEPFGLAVSYVARSVTLACFLRDSRAPAPSHTQSKLEAQQSLYGGLQVPLSWESASSIKPRFPAFMADRAPRCLWRRDETSQRFMFLRTNHGRLPLAGSGR